VLFVMAAVANEAFKDPVIDENDAVSTSGSRDTPLLGEKSPGVARIEALNAHTSFINRCCIFFSVFLVAYAYGLDATVRGVYQPQATADFKEHSLLATVNVIRSVVAAAAQPSAAKIGESFS
jgi:MFS transporter, SIT family, siderophore-iron:H+ symporter